MPTVDAATLFERAIAWLRDSYNDHRFHVERDLVWTVQLHLTRLIRSNGLPYRVFNDYPMVRGVRPDIAILDEEGTIEVAAEFKYEPSHARKDIWPNRFCPTVVFWDMQGVAKDIVRVQQFVDGQMAKTAYAIFVDEGGYFRNRDAHLGSQWIDWNLNDAQQRVSVLWTRAGIGPRDAPYKMNVLTLSDIDLSRFVAEVEQQCSLALYAYRSIWNYSPRLENRDQWDHRTINSHAMISHTANVAKLFWSPSQSARSKARCEQLREALGVDETWLIADRVTRNYLEHYDERLEKWIHKPDRKPLLDTSAEPLTGIDPVTGETLPRVERTDVETHRTFSIGDTTVYVEGKAFRAMSVATELWELRGRAVKWMIDRNYWDEDWDKG